MIELKQMQFPFDKGRNTNGALIFTGIIVLTFVAYTGWRHNKSYQNN